MNIYVTGRSPQITDAMKNYITEKLERIEKYSHKNIDVHVILDVQKYRYIAEVNVKTNIVNIHCTEEDSDMTVACDTVVDRISRQMRKSKEKVQHHRGSSNLHEVEEILSTESTTHVGEKIFAHNIQIEQPDFPGKSLQDALAYIVAHRTPLFVFNNTDTGVVNIIYKRENDACEIFTQLNHASQHKGTLHINKQTVQLSTGDDSSDTQEIIADCLTPDEAADLVCEQDQPFTIFLNKENGKLSLIQIRQNGSFSLVELPHE